MLFVFSCPVFVTVWWFQPAGFQMLVWKHTEAGWCVVEVEKGERIETGAGWWRFERRDRNARTDLQQQQQQWASAQGDQTVKRLKQGLWFGESVGEGGGEERRRARAKAWASVSGCRLANLSSSGLMRQQKARLKQKASFKAGPASRLLLC